MYFYVKTGHQDDPDLMDFLKMYHPSDDSIYRGMKEYLDILNLRAPYDQIEE